MQTAAALTSASGLLQAQPRAVRAFRAPLAWRRAARGPFPGPAQRDVLPAACGAGAAGGRGGAVAQAGAGPCGRPAGARTSPALTRKPAARVEMGHLNVCRLTWCVTEHATGDSCAGCTGRPIVRVFLPPLLADCFWMLFQSYATVGKTLLFAKYISIKQVALFLPPHFS